MTVSKAHGLTTQIPLKSEQIDQLLIRAIDQSPTIVVITDNQGNIEYVNAKFTEITQYESDEVLGKNPKILKSDKHSAKYYQQLWKTLNECNSWHGEFYNKKKGWHILLGKSANISNHGRQ